MVNITREITKEEYDMVISTGHDYIPDELEEKFFSVATLIGYGVYGTRVYEKDGKYYLNYNRGDTCD